MHVDRDLVGPAPAHGAGRVQGFVDVHARQPRTSSPNRQRRSVSAWQSRSCSRPTRSARITSAVRRRAGATAGCRHAVVSWHAGWAHGAADDGISTVFSSDLRRAVETAEIAFADTPIPILLDWRLRECDYGTRNGALSETHASDRRATSTSPTPAARPARGDRARHTLSRRSAAALGRSARLVIGHVATRWAFEHHLNGVHPRRPRGRGLCVAGRLGVPATVAVKRPVASGAIGVRGQHAFRDRNRHHPARPHPDRLDREVSDRH